MYNMEIYCTRPYCIENPYWTRRLVQYGFSIQYRLVQYISILYITLYNNLLIQCRSCHGRDRMVDGFTTTYAIGTYHH